MGDRKACETPDIPKSISDKLCRIVLDMVPTFIAKLKLGIPRKKCTFHLKDKNVFLARTIERCNLFTEKIPEQLSFLYDDFSSIYNIVDIPRGSRLVSCHWNLVWWSFSYFRSCHSFFFFFTKISSRHLQQQKAGFEKPVRGIKTRAQNWKCTPASGRGGTVRAGERLNRSHTQLGVTHCFQSH